MTAEKLWEIFCDHNLDLDPETLYWTQWSFSKDRYAAMVLAGMKTATTSLYDAYEIDGDKIPEVGDYAVILDSSDEALFIIQDTKVEIKKFCEVDAEHAFKEGEGDQSLEYWRKAHQKALSADCEEYGTEFSEDTLCVLEEFQIVFHGGM
jgi:uncharacterized protein YhfF